MADLPPHVAQSAAQVTIGVDTHKDVHVAAARDHLGHRLATTHIPTTPAGYAELLAWAGALGEVRAWGIEGTSSYGAGLARFLAAHHQQVIEVDRPNRATRRRRGNSDPIDADAAARAVQAGEATGRPKTGDGPVEMLRALRAARRTAVKARTQAINALKALVVTAPVELRQALAGLPTRRLVTTTAALILGKLTTPAAATMLALRSLAERSTSTSMPRSACCQSNSTPSPPPTPPDCGPCSGSALTALPRC